MRDDRDNHAGGILLPILAQQLYRWPVIHPNDPLQDGQQLRSQAGPAFAEDEVVAILNAEAGEFFQQVEFVELFLKVEKGDLPALSFENAFEGFGGAAMAATGIKENDCESAAHNPFLLGPLRRGGSELPHT